MSILNIFDVKKGFDPDDVRHSLTKSITLETKGLAKLLDAESDTVLYALNEFKAGRMTVEDLHVLSKSADKVVNNIIRLLLLLQFEKENERGSLPMAVAAIYEDETVISESSAEEKKADSEDVAPNLQFAQKNNPFCLFEKGKGFIPNRSDDFFGCTASVRAYIPSAHKKSRMLFYHVSSETSELTLCSSAYDLNINYYNDNSTDTGDALISGKGIYENKSKKLFAISEPVNYTLHFWYKSMHMFKLEITKKSDGTILHDTGIILLEQ